MSEIGVVYIARGLDPNWRRRFTRFVDSWGFHPPGIECQVYIIYKEFTSGEDLQWAVQQFEPLNVINIFNYMDFNSFGGGCFLEACNHVNEPLLCTLVSTSEVMHKDWLARLYFFYRAKAAGLVGCTGSKEGNLHVRDTAILVELWRYYNIIKQFDFKTSKEGYLEFEHGPNNLTIQIMRANEPVFVVEKERVIEPSQWGHTTYRGNMHNVLVHDRGSRDFQDL
jgi:hypothetical protein